MARPTKYKPEYDDMAFKLAKHGRIDTEMAFFFEVSPQTFYNWQKSHRGFLESIKRGKAIADAKVVEALLKRALGYKYTETRITTIWHLQ